MGHADTPSMGRILREDIQAVVNEVRLDTVVGEKIALRAAGPTTFKGLCPFHDEKSPSFQVDPDKGFWYCFGCSQGGDVIDFVRQADSLTFTEAVQKLADSVNYTLRFEEDSPEEASAYARKRLLTQIMVDAHDYYREAFAQLSDGHPAKTLLFDRGFTLAHCSDAGVGYAPDDWRSLLTHLESKGHPREAIMEAGLLSDSNGNIYDRFRNRVLWTIRDPAGKPIGFGGRKLSSEDPGPKYLNSPETPLYKKSQVLYNLDVARTHVATENRIVVVEGYTDVMAFQAAGINTAIASCGTAFGAEHVTLLRRVIGDGGGFKGDIIFTFDGDSAGQKAASKTFALDAKFSRHTTVVVVPDGLDPCDLRARDGDDSLQHLLDTRTPLFEHVLATTLSAHQLDTVEGRRGALDAVVPVLAEIRDDMLRATYDRWVSTRLGVEAWRVAKHVREYEEWAAHHQRTTTPPPENIPPADTTDAPPPPDDAHAPSDDPFGIPEDPHGLPGDDPFGDSASPGPTLNPTQVVVPAITPPPPAAPGTDLWVEREMLQTLLQHPELVRDWYESVDNTAYTHPANRLIHQAAHDTLATGEITMGFSALVAQLLKEEDAPPPVVSYVAELAVSPLGVAGNDDTIQAYALETVVQTLDAEARRTIATLKAQLAQHQIGSNEYSDAYQQLHELEQYRKTLRASLN